MNRAIQDHRGQPRSEAIPRDRVRKYRRVVGPNERILTCSLYRSAAGLEVRAEYTDNQLVHSMLAMTVVEADYFAAAWKDALDAAGDFTDLDVSQ